MTSSSVAVIDYGMGNLHSVASALQHIAPDTQIAVTADPVRVAEADRVIFPGVGAIRDCMAEINRLGFATLLREQFNSGKPVLGICVGMQALMQHSEENNGVDCIGLIPGEVKFFGNHHQDAQGRSLKVPHMGWNQVDHTDHPLWFGIPQLARFYFVHSYYVRATDRTQVAATCTYGETFDAALAQRNLFAVQFHPEKSHTAGLQLLKNFLRWDGQV